MPDGARKMHLLAGGPSVDSPGAELSPDRERAAGASSTGLECRVLDTGRCLALERVVVRGGRWRRVECPSLVAVLRHPREGVILWDTGYAPRLLACTRALPYRFYRWATPLRIAPERAAAAQLARLGIDAADVRHVVLSHFHADHVAGLADFPRARVWARRE